MASWANVNLHNQLFMLLNTSSCLKIEVVVLFWLSVYIYIYRHTYIVGDYIVIYFKYKIRQKWNQIKTHDSEFYVVNRQVTYYSMCLIRCVEYKYTGRLTMGNSE